MNNFIVIVLLLTLSFACLANAQLAEMRQKFKDAERFATFALVVWIFCAVRALWILGAWIVSLF